MIFYKKYEVIRCSEQFIFGNQPIEEVDHSKYLGIIISNGTKRFSQHFSYLKEKASRAIIAASIYIRQAVKGQLPVNLYLKVFDTQIRPILEYASEIFVNTVCEMRYNQFISQWKTDLEENRKWPKLDTYKMIKHDYRVAPHILYVRNKIYQRALTRLKVSSHKLNIEAGRHFRPYIPRQQRVCLHCTTGELDDEFHFLLICHFHSEGRYSML